MTDTWRSAAHTMAESTPSVSLGPGSFRSRGRRSTRSSAETTLPLPRVPRGRIQGPREVRSGPIPAGTEFPYRRRTPIRPFSKTRAFSRAWILSSRDPCRPPSKWRRQSERWGAPVPSESAQRIAPTLRAYRFADALPQQCKVAGGVHVARLFGWQELQVEGGEVPVQRSADHDRERAYRIAVVNVVEGRAELLLVAIQDCQSTTY